jgi:hypothetical protein
MQINVRRALMAHAVALSAHIYPAGANRWDWSAETRSVVESAGDIEAGAYLAALVGLPAASWPKIKREAAKLAEREKEAKVKADRVAAEKRALRLSDMSPKDWRQYVARLGGDYTAQGFESLATELRRARKIMMAANKGKLATAGRLATIRARLKQVTAERESFDARRQPRLDRNALAVHLATIRNYLRASEAGKAALGYHDMLNLGRAADYVAERGRIVSLKENASRLAIFADERGKVILAEQAERRERERENAAKAEAERRALWLAGEPVGRISFDADCGGAALRIVGDTLQTSHGAEVPLAHAVKVFRFVKLIREANYNADGSRKESEAITEWQRNGKTIRVGHFQVDRIRANGDFIAGCHQINWQEVERVAKMANVFDCEASADAVEPSPVHA